MTSLHLASAIKLILNSYNNCDDVQLCWRSQGADKKDQGIFGCIGFMIERQRSIDGEWQSPEVLRNRVGFSAQKTDDIQAGSSQPSSVWPFQRYDWTDHGANNGQTVRYRVSAMGLSAGAEAGASQLNVLCSSKWTDEIQVNEKAGEDVSVYFNRGAVMSQYVARIAREKKWKPTDIAKNVKNITEPLRVFLSGELRIAMLKILDEVAANPFLELYAALYELTDTELIDRLCKIGPRAHIILSDGSNSRKEEGKTVYIDGNEGSRKTLNEAGVVVHDRILGKLGLGHNKLMVTVDSRNENVLSAWTGSTNWSSSGLCTQLNNGILFKDSKVASLFFSYWKALKDAGSLFTPKLMEHNGGNGKRSGNTEVWFTRTEKPKPATAMPADIEYLKGLISSSRESVLYVMFQPGSDPLQEIILKDMDPDHYVRGVVSTVISSNQEKFELISEQHHKDYQTDLIQPQGISEDFGYWVEEVVRGQFIPYNGRPGIGYAITHTKMIVIDAFSENPIVITGSHNFSKSASQSNDENFVVIRGNKALAKHYAVACISMYNHYRWRAYVYDKLKAGEELWSHLDAHQEWQLRYLSNPNLIQHLNIWCPQG